MSWIDEALLYDCYGNAEVIEQVNGELAERDPDRRQQFAPLDMDAAGGAKFFTGNVWAAAFNYVLPEHIKAAVAGASWRHPENVVLILDGDSYEEGAEVWTVAQLRAASSRMGGEG